MSILLISLSVQSCQKKEKTQNPFGVATNRIGHLTHTTTLNQLDSIYANDSIVRNKANNTSLSNASEIEIYEKGGKKLLILEATQEDDATATIENIEIIDPRYKTIAGLSCNGVFKDIKDHYTISKINNTLSAAVIFIDSIHASLTIDKKELPDTFKFNTDIKIEATQIPDTAKIKHFLIHWDYH